MRLRHLVLLRFTADTTADDIDAIASALRALPDAIPEIVQYEVGPNLALADGTWDFGISATFDSVDGWAAYRDHPRHQAVISELIAPRVAERSAVQFEI